MEASSVLDVLTALSDRGLSHWLDGGWGVDALLGLQTRPHDDVDLVVERNALADVIEALGSLGFVVTEDLSPVRVVLAAADGRWVDLHPVTFDGEGTGWQRGANPDGTDCPYPSSGFGWGRILDRRVPCLTAELQLAHHSGYVPRPRDRADMRRLADFFTLTLPANYTDGGWEDSNR